MRDICLDIDFQTDFCELIQVSIPARSKVNNTIPIAIPATELFSDEIVLSVPVVMLTDTSIVANFIDLDTIFNRDQSD